MRSKRSEDGKIKSPIVFLLVLTGVHFSKTSPRNASEWTTLIRIIKGLSLSNLQLHVNWYVHLEFTPPFPVSFHSFATYLPRVNLVQIHFFVHALV